MNLEHFLSIVWDPITDLGAVLLREQKTAAAPGDAFLSNPTLSLDIYASTTLAKKLEERGFTVYSEEGEETTVNQREDSFFWLDPLDGSRNFAEASDPEFMGEGGKNWAISLGYIENGIPVAGIVNQAAQGRVIYAVRGEGAWIQRINREGLKEGDAQKINPQKYNSHLQRAILGRSTRDDLEGRYKALELDILPLREPVLTWKLLMLALGEAEVYCKPGNKVNLWDIAAANVILQEVGGKITTPSGHEIDYTASDPCVRRGIIASRGYRHNLLVDN